MPNKVDVLSKLDTLHGCWPMPDKLADAGSLLHSCILLPPKFINSIKFIISQKEGHVMELFPSYKEIIHGEKPKHLFIQDEILLNTYQYNTLLTLFIICTMVQRR